METSAPIEQTPSNYIREKLQDITAQSQIAFQNVNPYIPLPFLPSTTIKRSAKLSSNFKVANIVTVSGSVQAPKNSTTLLLESGTSASGSTNGALVVVNSKSSGSTPNKQSSTALTTLSTSGPIPTSASRSSNAVVARRAPVKVPEPKWHAPWELSAVVSGHLGWVRSIAFDPSNEWFATGSADRTIKIWDTAKCCAGVDGGLKLTLTGHLSAVRGLAVSVRHPYLFSAAEDKQVNCWDLEYNKIIRHYHGHLSGVFCLALHPTLDLLVTGGRDSVARVWDIRTKHQIHVLGGHGDAVSSILTSSVDPQVVTGSHDSTVKLWDLAAGKARSTLTQHKKAVRALAASPTEMTFASASADNIKKWQTRDGRFLKNFSGHNSVVNCLAANEDGVLVSGGDNGSVHFWDYETGYCFQSTKTIVQPGSLDAEAGIFATSFDLSGSRLFTCEADKSIKIWKENESANEDSHPIDMRAWTKQSLQLKRF